MLPDPIFTGRNALPTLGGVIAGGLGVDGKWFLSDAFARPDENPLSGIWDNTDAFWGPCKLVSGQAVSADADSGVSFINRATNPNQFAQGRAGTTFSLSAPMCRYSAGGNAYFAFFNGFNSCSLQRYNAGAGTTLLNVSPPSNFIALTSVLRLDTTGTGATVTLRLYADGVQFGGDVLDSDPGRLLSGKVGCHGYQGVNGLSNWAGGEL